MMEARGRPEEKGHRCVGVRCSLVTGIMEWLVWDALNYAHTAFMDPITLYCATMALLRNGKRDWERGSHHGVPSGCPEHLHVSLFSCMTLLPLFYFSRRLSLFKGESQKTPAPTVVTFSECPPRFVSLLSQRSNPPSQLDFCLGYLTHLIP